MLTEPTAETQARWADAACAVELLAVDPAGLGGICLRAQSGPVRDVFLSLLDSHFTPIRRMPPGIADDALLGGLDLPATLQAGRPMLSSGLLRSAAGGIVLATMAERMSAGTAARLTAALDAAPSANTARDAAPSAHAPLDAAPSALAPRDAAAPLALVALDEGIEPEEHCAAALLDRLAFHLDLATLSHRDAAGGPADHPALQAAQALLPQVELDDAVLEALCNTAMALGIGSARAPLLAVRTARAAAALDGRDRTLMQDAILATRLVLAPRATRLPQAADPAPDEPGNDDTPPNDIPPDDTAPDDTAPDRQADQASAPGQADQPDPDAPDPDRPRQDSQTPSDLLLEAARAAIPPNLLARLQAQDFRGKSQSAGTAGARQSGGQRGRPVGLRAAPPAPGLRLNLIETLRAAAPWQPLRTRTATTATPTPGRVQLRREDFRVTRSEQRSRTTTIFLVDASGSSALNRLAEAKGAVELLLADCYRRRDQVAVIAFRGKAAQLLLPPTRSLVRAKRSLAGLPGGGGTPLAAGIDAGFLLAETVRRTGATPTLVLLTDGRANVTRAGTGGRELAASEAAAAARRLRAAGIAALVLDTSPRPAAEAGRLAQAMGALYVPLPYANAANVSSAVRVAAGGANRVAAGGAKPNASRA